jgi:hypothetical protein
MPHHSFAFTLFLPDCSVDPMTRTLSLQLVALLCPSGVLLFEPRFVHVMSRDEGRWVRDFLESSRISHVGTDTRDINVRENKPLSRPFVEFLLILVGSLSIDRVSFRSWLRLRTNSREVTDRSRSIWWKRIMRWWWPGNIIWSRWRGGAMRQLGAGPRRMPVRMTLIVRGPRKTADF